MESLIETFRVDLTLLIAQAVNFGIVIAALYFFALKPLTRLLEERRQKIERGVQEAEEARQRHAEAEQAYQHKLQEARSEATQIVEQAKTNAEQEQEQIVASAREEVAELMRREQEKRERERAQLVNEVKRDSGELVVSALEAMLKEGVDPETERARVARIMETAER